MNSEFFVRRTTEVLECRVLDRTRVENVSGSSGEAILSSIEGTRLVSKDEGDVDGWIEASSFYDPRGRQAAITGDFRDFTQNKCLLKI